MDVHSVGFLENWGFGDFQFLKSNPNEPEQPIETSHLDQISQMDFVAGSDSMAWDFSTRMSACKAGVSNTIERRKSGMTEWMQAALARITPLEERRHGLLLAA